MRRECKACGTLFDITPEEYRAALRAPDRLVALAAQNALRDERVRAAERERIAREIEGITARRMDGGYLSPSAIAARVREGGDTNAA